MIGAQNGGNLGLTAFYLGNVGQSIFGLLNFCAIVLGLVFNDYPEGKSCLKL
jgi:hypothetical protein